MACLALRIEVARGIIRVLSQDLRARVWDLNDCGLALKRWNNRQKSKGVRDGLLLSEFR
jgi:hypothetical protein